MLPRFDAAVLPVRPGGVGAGAGAPVGDDRQAALQRVLQGIVGKTVTVEVMSKYQDGSSLVKVADTAVRMMLPPNVNVGDQVPLTVLTASPRPTFQLGNGTPGAPALVYSESAAADGGEALYSPPSLSPQQAAGQPPGTARPPAPGAAAQAPAEAGGQAGVAADAAEAGGDALPGQPRTGAAATPANPSAQQAAGRPGADPAAAATTPGKPGDAAAGQAGRALPGAAAAAAQPGAAQAAGAAGAAGAAVPAEAVKPQSLAATLLGKAPMTPASELPPLDHTTPQSTLSNTARVLTTVLTTATAQGGMTAQLALIGKTALFGNGLPATDELAQKLQDTISKSGLFYESHVTQWAKGERTLPELMREPQMQRLAQGGEQAARTGAGGPDLTAAQMINQQLHTHEQGRVQWQGEAWPGQQMQWDIRRQQREGGKHDGGDDAAPEQVWRSGVRFRFPLLGEVSAAVTMIGGQVHIQIQTGNDDTAGTLRAHAARLETAMEAAGAPLSSLQITQDESGGADVG